MNKNSAFLSFKAIKIAFEYNASLFKKKERKIDMSFQAIADHSSHTILFFRNCELILLLGKDSGSLIDLLLSP